MFEDPNGHMRERGATAMKDNEQIDLGAGLSVIVPCFNEAETVEAILRSLRQSLPQAELIVVDDGSTDRSRAVVESMVDSLSLQFVARDRNGGKGAAVRDGLVRVAGNYVAIQDADLEYDPADLAELHKAAIQANRDWGTETVVYGSRYLVAGKAPQGHLAAYLATRLIAIVAWLLYGRWLSDPLTCYKLFPVDCLRRLDLKSNGFELCTEMNAKLFRGGVQIVELPISYQPRSFDEGKKIGAKDFFRMVAALLRWRVTPFLKLVDESRLPQAGTFYVITRLAIGALLMYAGIAKITSGSPMLVASQWVIPVGVVTAWGVVECLLGWVTLTFVSHQSLRKFLTVLFSAFAAILVVEWSRGATQCQCLGGTGLPIMAMVGLDVAIVACLFAFRRDWGQPSRMPAGILGDVAFHGRFVLPALLVASVVFFGSPRSAIDYVAGKSVLVRSQQQFAGSIEQNATATTVFDLRNASANPIRVLGAKASCRCVA
ncbi:MAG: glycosyltransferase, partial [Rubripirellula sp.]